MDPKTRCPVKRSTIIAANMMSAMAFFFFKQKTAYEISECDWSPDVCSSDLAVLTLAVGLILVTNLSKKRQLSVATASIQKDTKERTDLKKSIASSLASEVDAVDA